MTAADTMRAAVGASPEFNEAESDARLTAEDPRYPARKAASEALYKHAAEWIDAYEWTDGDNGYYTPNERERSLIHDAFHGLTADEEYQRLEAAWRSLCGFGDPVAAAEALSDTALAIVGDLMMSDPSTDTPLGIMLTRLADAVELYERATLPPPLGNAPFPLAASPTAAPREEAEPMGWLVFQPQGSEYDFLVYANRNEAENDVADQAEGAEALPLYLHAPATRPIAADTQGDAKDAAVTLGGGLPGDPSGMNIAARVAELGAEVVALSAALVLTEKAFEQAMRETWQMVNPTHPPPAGSYAGGLHDGICTALRTLRENFKRARAALSPSLNEQGKGDGRG